MPFDGSRKRHFEPGALDRPDGAVAGMIRRQGRSGLEQPPPTARG
ncbi:MAG: hypothetical protein AVDCRST_MAG10-852 [uncultured Acidimicrobiales bacterium]|uniref:Uncharacterized protein n=1 Tax=uncultured Acidimicrobiales bacterium TaxID=310071 RepID=A0A6J4HIJ9_9ACTN|nr:MAG: hypothetical protein AVDCRST_MAG10-852 [uncultured Acidimicrobiales bacterium]